MSVIPPPGGDPVVVRSGDDLSLLRAGKLPIRRRGLRLELPGLGEEEARTIADRIVTLQGECGCEVGSWAAYPAIAGVLLWGVLDPPGMGRSLVIRIALSLGAVLMAAMVGKGVGIGRALRRRDREIDGLLARRSVSVRSAAPQIATTG